MISLDEQIDFIRPFITGIPHGEMFEAILATLQSIKDAGDGVTERPKYDSYEDSEQGDIAYATDVSNYIDTLLSAYKRVCVERDGLCEQLERLNEKSIALISVNEMIKHRAEKAEASNKRLVDALQPFAFFAEQWNKNPINRLHDTLYSIHSGDDAAEFRLSDCQKAAELIG